VKGDVLIIAHRGASAYEPENTLRAIREAIALGCDFIEVDVRKSSDGALVVIHDEKVDRTTDGKGYVHEMTLKELKSLNIKRGREVITGERIPTLDEVAELIKGKVGLIVEVKVGGIEEDVIKSLERYGIEEDVIITSFNHVIVKRVKDLKPGIKAGVIVSCRPINPSRLAIDADADTFLSRYDQVDGELVKDLHDAGLRVFAWTVDEPRLFKELVELGVDGIVTNKPDLRMATQ